MFFFWHGRFVRPDLRFEGEHVERRTMGSTSPARKFDGRAELRTHVRCPKMRHDPAPHDFDGWVARLGLSSCRQRAKQHLLSSGPSAVPALRRGLGHTKAIVRRQCVNILDHLLDEESVPALVAAVEDVDPQVAWASPSRLGV